jgi:hypothetical protein
MSMPGRDAGLRTPDSCSLARTKRRLTSAPKSRRREGWHSRQEDERAGGTAGCRGETDLEVFSFLSSSFPAAVQRWGPSSGRSTDRITGITETREYAVVKKAREHYFEACERASLQAGRARLPRQDEVVSD